LIEEFAIAEIVRDPASGGSGRNALDALQAAGLLRYVRLSDSAFLSFLEMTGAAAPDDLGDGEAATIAYAEAEAATPIIDDKKALRIASSRSPERDVLTTIDLLSSPDIINSIPESDLADLLFSSLQNARMRVAPSCRAWVVSVLGAERAALCPSIGGRGR